MLMLSLKSFVAWYLRRHGLDDLDVAPDEIAGIDFEPARGPLSRGLPADKSCTYDSDWPGTAGDHRFPLPPALDELPGVGSGPSEAFRADPTRHARRFDAGDVPCGDPVTRDDADHIAQSEADLRSALADAGPGDTVWLNAGVHFDNPEECLVLTRGVTLAGARDPDDPTRATTISGTGSRLKPLIEAHEGARVTGLKIQGPTTEFAENDWRIQLTGIDILGDRVEIDDCIVRGWGVAGVRTHDRREGAPYDWHVHHCHLVDNPMQSYGYGVGVWYGEGLIQHNYFDHNRHAAASSGEETTAYEFCCNYAGPRTIQHVIDVHRGDEPGPGSWRKAGRWVEIHHNAIEATERVHEDRGTSAFWCRGATDQPSRFDANVLAHDHRTLDRDTEDWYVGQLGDAWVLSGKHEGSRNVRIENNHYGWNPEIGIPEDL